MDRLSRVRDEDAVRDVRPAEPPAPEPLQAGSLAWASAIGNQAVARLAREASPEQDEQVAEEDAVVDEAAPEAEPAGPDIDDLAEDEIPG